MIAKKYRLSENEVKKVLQKRKPFFSHHLVANISPNTLGFSRIGIVLSSKHAPGSVNRNAFRRILYDTAKEYLPLLSSDIVFVCKKGIVLDYKNPESTKAIIQDSRFILRSLQKISR